MTGIGYWVVLPIWCFWDSTSPGLSEEVSVSSKNGFLKLAKASTGALIHFIFSILKASKASSGNAMAVFSVYWLHLLGGHSAALLSGHSSWWSTGRNQLHTVHFSVAFCQVGGWGYLSDALQTFIAQFLSLCWDPVTQKVISSQTKWHLDSFNFSPCYWNCLNTVCRWWRCSSSIWEYMITSSR